MEGPSLVIDCREAALWAALNARPDADALRLKSASLDLGDMWVVGAAAGAAEASQAVPTFVIERKAFADLAASIKDGRYREQKRRMLAHYPAHTITYVIEGAGSAWLRSGTTHGMPHAVYQGAIFHTMYRDGIHVVFTRDLNETAEWLACFARKVFDAPDKFVPGVPASPASALVPTVARRKMASIDPAVCFRLQLCQIPTISNKIATEIARAYPCWEALWGALQPLAPDQRLAALMKLPMVGRKKAEAVVAMLWPAPAAPMVE